MTGPVVAPRRFMLTVCAMSATVMQALDMTIANIALPYMQGSLNASLDQVNWVLTSYIVAAAIMTAPIAWLADRFGRKRLFIVCTAGFTVASLLCGVSHTITEMVLYRLMQGAFGAALVPLSQSVMLDAYPPEERGQAMAIWGMGVMLGPIMGPTLGSWLTETYSWHWVFLVNLPIGIVTIGGLLIFLEETTIDKTRSFDWFGFAALGTGIGALQLVLDRGEQLGWFNSTEIQIEFIVALTGLYFFVAHSLTIENPFIRFELFKDRNFLVGCLFMGIISTLLFGTMALIVPFMQNVMGYPIITSGLLLASRGIGTMISMMLVGRLLRIIEARWLIGGGLSILAITINAMIGFTDLTSPRHIAIVSLFQGFGIGFVFVPLSSVAFTTLKGYLRTDGASILTLSRNIFSSVGISVVIAQLTGTTIYMHARLAEAITPFNNALDIPAIAAALNMSMETALATLDQLITHQASIIAYANDFKMMLMFAVCALPFIFLIGNTRIAPQADAQPGHTPAFD